MLAFLRSSFQERNNRPRVLFVPPNPAERLRGSRMASVFPMCRVAPAGLGVALRGIARLSHGAARLPRGAARLLHGAARLKRGACHCPPSARLVPA